MSAGKESKDSPLQALQNPIFDANIGNLVFQDTRQFLNFLGLMGKYPFIRDFAIPTTFIFMLVKASQVYMRGLSNIYHMDTDLNHLSYMLFEKDSEGAVKELKEKVSFMTHDIPDWDVAFPIASLILLFCGRTRQVNVILICLAILGLCFSIHLSSNYFQAINLFICQVLLEVCNMMTMILVVELVPTYHRMLVLVVIVLGESCGTILISLIIRVSVDFDFNVGIEFVFPILGTLFILSTIVVKLTLGNSIYNLLARNSTDTLESTIKYLLKRSNLDETKAEVIVDSLAFTHTEIIESSVNILVYCFRAKKVIKDLMITGIMIGGLSALQLHANASLEELNYLYISDLWVVEAICYTVSAIYLLFFAFLIPRRRILIVLATLPLLLVLVALIYKFAYQKRVIDFCSLALLTEKGNAIYHGVCVILMVSLSYALRIVLMISFIEYVPTVIRAPAAGIVNFFGLSFTGNSRETYGSEAVNSVTAMAIVTLLSVATFLLTPHDDCVMSTYFSDVSESITSARKFYQIRMPALPDVVPTMKRRQYSKAPEHITRNSKSKSAEQENKKDI